MSDHSNEGIREVKFLLPSDGVNSVLIWMRQAMMADPHGAMEEGDAYRVQSIYLDTPGFDVFHRRGSNARAKFRLRRYNDAEAVFLERKLKRLGIVRKRRTMVDLDAVTRVRNGGDGNGWVGNWFARRLVLRRLIPTVLLNYTRVARYTDGPAGRIRVTLDRDLHAAPVREFCVPNRIDGPDLLQGRYVLEVKFKETLPAWVRERIEGFGLQISPCSKYRLAVQSCGLVVPEAVEAGPGSPTLAAPQSS